LNGLIISFLIKLRAGFIIKLNKHVNKSLLAFIDKPYNMQHDIKEYKTIIIFTTKINIINYILYIKDLINGYNNYNMKTCCI